MSRSIHHPTRDQIDLPMVLDCLSDPTRLAIVYTLALREQAATELCCGDFNALSGKSNLAYHFAKLRESGVVERDAEVVAMLTGHGLKDTAYILEQHGAGNQGQQEGH